MAEINILEEPGIRVGPGWLLEFTAQTVLGESPPLPTAVLRLDSGELVSIAGEYRTFTNNVANTITIALSDGQLVHAALTPPDDVITPGTMYGVIRLLSPVSTGGRIIRPLVSGLIDFGRGIVWPGGRLADALSSTGRLGISSPANPAAGAQFSQAFPIASRIEVESVRFRLITSAVVATRQMGIEFLSGGVVVFRAWAQATQAASLTRDYWFDVRGFGAASVLTDVFAPIPFMPLEGTPTVRSIADSFQAADQLQSIFIYRTLRAALL